MTDPEMTQLCAGAMGVAVRTCCSSEDCNDSNLYQQSGGFYAPLHNDAQSMALLKWLHRRGAVSIGITLRVYDKSLQLTVEAPITDGDLNRAIVQCAAELQREITK